MKLRSTLLALAALLLISSLAGAGPLSTSADSSSATLAAIFAAPAAPESAAAANAQLPSFAPTDKSIVLCGSCSDSLCSGKHIGDFCKSQSGKTYTCQPAYVTCNPRDCECWNGPLP